MQKQFGMAAQGWRMAIARARSARASARTAQSRARKYIAIVHIHQAVADREQAEADSYAIMLINELTPELVRQRLSSLEPAMAAIITRRFGDNLADARTRARVFEACDFAQWEGGIDELALIEHESIWPKRDYV